MKLKTELEFINMDNEIIAVPVGKGATHIHGILKLNAEGKEIVSLLKEETTEDHMVDTLSLTYQNNHESLARYVHLVVEELRSAGLIDE